MRLQAVTTVEIIGDTLDRQNLTLLRKRFLQMNHDRLARTRMALSYQQEIFLDSLQLLFHCNHPMLPGFVSHSTPAGLSGYKPDKRQLAIGKTLARSFCMSGGYEGESIWAIYLMGSLGSLAQSHKSDFDVWLCHKPGLSKSALQELEQKCQRISQWADTLRIEAHFFLMDCDAFKHGEQLSLDEESSGSAQRLLLLDEFYRTALYIGGRLPVWWFSPADSEQGYDAYTKELIDKRFLRPNTTLDFGGVSHIPDGEFIGAGIWQLYKAIESPYKSVLKLLLMEAYVHDYPNISPLSLEYKNAIYHGELQINDLDPYILVYKRIERYLKEEEDHSRLDLVRRCFYFKISKPLSKPVSKRGKSWQRLLLESLVQEWGWSPEYIHMLDQRSDWKTLKVKEERNLLVHALNHSYDMLLNFAQRSGAARSISTSELNILGRKLQAAFERRPGKLEHVNPGISKNIAESTLTFVEASLQEEEHVNPQAVWQLFGSDTGADTPLRQTRSPVELLLWCHINQIVDGHFRLDVSQAPSTNDSQLRRTLARLQQWLPMPMPSPEHDNFQGAAVPIKVFMLINVGAEKQSPLGDHIHRLSNKSDPFRYGGFEENLVASVDIIVLNSWQEMTSQRFEGKAALLKVLQEYLSLCMPGSRQAPPELEIDCVGMSHASLLTQRVKQWFHEICSCYYSGAKPSATRYLFEMGGRNYSLQYSGAKLSVLEHKSREQLIHYLGESQKHYSPMVVDSYALHGHALKLIARRTSSSAIHVYYQRKKNSFNMMVMDELGSLIEFQSSYTENWNSLNSLHVFMRSILNQQSDQGVQPNINFGVYPIEFYELKEDDLHHLSMRQKIISPDIEKLGLLELTATVSCNSMGRFEYDFNCNGQSFKWSDLKQDVFFTVAKYILDQRVSGRRYPVFITSLNLDKCTEQLSSTKILQMSHYLRVKIDLERKLSRSLLGVH